MENITEVDHAESNGRAWLASIVQMVEELEAAGDDDDAKDAVRERIIESPLSVQTRCTAWHEPGTDTPASEDDEFEILLSTGGPAARIFGQLGQHMQPENIRLEIQGWFKPWTALTNLTQTEGEALEAFVNEFYFGDG